MAVPPSIPTSFVPRAGMAQRASGFDLATAFRVVSFGIITLTLIAAGAVASYSFYLSGVQKSKDAALIAAESGIDTSSVQTFVRLRDRLTSARTLLDNHVTLSHFFTVLESATLARMRFSALTITVQPDSTAKITLVGDAASFNALAAESAAFASNPLIKDAIFSGLAINKNGGVSFNLGASLDKTLVVEGLGAPPPATSGAGAATTTVSTTTSSTTP